MVLLNYRQPWSYQFSAGAAAMILSDVFERFSQDSPLSVMAQAVLENALNPAIAVRSADAPTRLSGFLSAG
jgi:hypothetical protein